jgi:hypothetical protein
MTTRRHFFNETISRMEFEPDVPLVQIMVESLAEARILYGTDDELDMLESALSRDGWST